MTVLKKIFTRLPGITLGMLAITGFAQMPIFKRYYIADIPGFGWLAKFYVTHYMHYLLATLLLGLLAYQVVDGWLTKGNASQYRLPVKAQWVILGGLVITGIMLVIRNLPGYHFSPGTVVALDLIHLGLTILLAVSAVIRAITPD